MVSFDVKRAVACIGTAAACRGLAPTRASALAVGLLSLLCSPVATIAQETFEPVATDAEQQRLVELIRDAQSRDGPFSPELITPFTELGLLYEESGDHELAAAATDRALQLVRVNEGLYTLDQIPLLQRAMANEESSGNFGAAEELERDLEVLIARHPGDVRTVPVLREFGDRQMEELRQLLAGELPLPVMITSGTFIGDDRAFASRSERARYMVRKAWRYYTGAIRVLLDQRAYGSDDLTALEMQLVRISYLHSGSYESGRSSLLRQLSYKVAKDEPLLPRVQALLRVADWDLLFTHNGLAVDTYAEIYALMKNEDMPAEVIDEMFSPAVPVMLPTFLPNPLDTREAGATGYIDVSFGIHKYGSARDVEIVGASASASAEQKDELVRVIRLSDFRPQIMDGTFDRTTPVNLRYYLHSESDVPEAVVGKRLDGSPY